MSSKQPSRLKLLHFLSLWTMCTKWSLTCSTTQISAQCRFPSTKHFPAELYPWRNRQSFSAAYSNSYLWFDCSLLIEKSGNERFCNLLKWITSQSRDLSFLSLCFNDFVSLQQLWSTIALKLPVNNILIGNGLLLYFVAHIIDVIQDWEQNHFR